MKFTVSRDQFAEQITWVAKQLPPSPPLPVLAGVRIEVSAATSSATIATFDFEKAARAHVPVSDADTSGVVVAPAKRVARFLAKLPRRFDTLEVVTDASKLMVRTADRASSVTVLTLPADDYPTPFADVESVAGTIAAADFAAAATRLAVAAGTDTTLPFLTGAQLRFRDQTLEGVTTDRYRIAAVRIPTETVGEAALPPAIVVPMIHLSAAARALKSAGSVTLGIEVFDDNSGIDRCTFTGANRSLTVRLADSSTYPCMDRFFAADYSAFATVPVRALAEAVELVVAAVDLGSDIPVRLDFGPDRLTVRTSYSDETQADAAAPASLRHADTFAITFRAKFLLTALKTFDSMVRFELSTPNTASRLTEASGDERDTGYQHLLHPIRTAA